MRDRLKSGLVRRQVLMFVSMLVTGAALLVIGVTTITQLLSEIGFAVGLFLAGQGIGFITVGVAGLVMSWTTTEIGAGIKEAVREVGAQNLEIGRQNLEIGRQNLEVGRQNADAIALLAKSQQAVGEGIKEAVREVGRQNLEVGRQNAEAIALLAKSQQAVGEGLKEVVREGIKEAVREGIKEAVREAGRQNGSRKSA